MCVLGARRRGGCVQVSEWPSGQRKGLGEGRERLCLETGCCEGGPSVGAWVRAVSVQQPICLLASGYRLFSVGKAGVGALCFS